MTEVLIATDGSELAIEAARRARQLLDPEAHYTVLSVVPAVSMGTAYGADGLVPGSPGAGMPAADMEEVDRALTNEHARAAAATAGAMGVEATQRVEHGDPAQTICDYAERHHVDVIVLGTHGRGPLARLFLGSVSEHVVRHAPCPVLVIRHRDPEHPEAEAKKAKSKRR